MYRHIIAVSIIVLIGNGLVAGVEAREVKEDPPTAQVAADLPALLATAPMDTFTLGQWTFDDGQGGPDPQGWTSHDIYGEQATYFHVDDFAGMDPPYAPLEGARSMWCGVREDCTYAAAPGYGFSWRQYFETTTGFATSGDVTVSFITRYDSEPGYDYTYLRYQSKTGAWQTLAQFGWQGQSFESHTIPGDSLDGTARIRFFFSSDGAFDDQSGLFPTDGAVVIDSLLVTDATGTVDYQDFEAEVVGATTTADGDWYAHAEAGFGDYAGLFDGATVLQEDSLVTNDTYLWGFFSGSPDTYACGGHPEQAAVPLGADPGSSGVADFLHNEIRSPWFPFREDVNGDPVPWQSQQLLLAFDVYRDLPVANGVYYSFKIRFLVDDCATRWWGGGGAWYGDDKQWYRQVSDFSERIEPDATHMQVALNADDWCSYYCGQSTPGTCHSHAPLFDNVAVYRVRELVSDAGDTPAPVTRLEQNHPNPFNPSTTIRYSVGAAGPARLAIYDVAGRRVRTLADGHHAPDAYAVQWDGRDDGGRAVATGIYFYRLDTAEGSATRKMVLLK